MNREEKILSLQQKYQKILLNDGGLQTLCNALIEEVDNPVFLLDKYQDDTIYITKALKADKEFYNYLEEKEIKASEEIFCEYDILIKRVIYDWQGKEVREVQVKLSHNEETLGFLVILEENKLEKDAYIAILQAAYAFSLKLHQNYIVQRLAQKCNSELIEDLVGGRVKSKEELIKRGELAGWDLSLPYQLYTLRIDFSKIYSENNKGTTLYYYELEEQIIRYLHRIIRTHIKEKYIIFSYEKDIVLLINYISKTEKLKKDIELIYNKIQKAFKKIDIMAAGGLYSTDCREIADSFKKAIYTLDFLENTEQEKNIVFYEELGVLRLLWNIDKKELFNFANEYLNELIKYSREKDNEWLETLEVFLEEDGDINISSERLSIHPNTMRYRIKQIQEILGLDFDSFDDKLNLTIAYKIYKFIISSEKFNYHIEGNK